MTEAVFGDNDIVFLGYVDAGGILRGKGIAGREWPFRRSWGAGWPPANLSLTPFGTLPPNPWGSRGDTFIVPVGDAITIPRGALPPLRLALGAIKADDGTPWPACPRAFLDEALSDLERETGLRLKGAFEHEFMYDGLDQRPGDAFSFEAHRRLGPFPEALAAALDQAGISVETLIPEYAPSQVEVPIAPAIGSAIADQAAIFREVVRSVAQAFGHRATFVPVAAPGAVGNGCHFHFSLIDRNGAAAGHDASSPTGLSAVAAAFLAGIRRRLPDFVALTAPTVVSYERLQPNRWSAAWNSFAVRDREAALRICPVRPDAGRSIADQFNVEFRALDATANPYLAIGALVRAGIQGVRDRLPPDAPLDGDPAEVAAVELARRGIERLPTSLGQALDRLEARGRDLLPAALADLFLIVKREEVAMLADLPAQEVADRYRAVF
ncbi:MAG: glutamine synthetase [Alphaproteobacteria bacterium]